MELSWNSKRGTHRKTNNDFLGVLNHKNYCVCLLLDASSKTEESSKFSQEWVSSFIRRLSAHEYLSDEIITHVLQVNHESFRRRYLFEIASYACVYIDKYKPKAFALVVGDCRVGNTDRSMQNIIWRTQVHTLANATGEELTVDALKKRERNVLTRALNARRFEKPELSKFSIESDLVLATDGFWVPYELQDNARLDDESYLVIKFEQKEFIFSPIDSENFFILDLAEYQ